MSAEGESVRRYRVTQTIEVTATDLVPALAEANRLWDAEGVEAHNERARHRSCLTVELVGDDGSAIDPMGFNW